jgi:hypothetical protein
MASELPNLIKSSFLNVAREELALKESIFFDREICVDAL